MPASNKWSGKFQLEDNRIVLESRFQDIIRPSGLLAEAITFSDLQCSESSRTLKPQYFKCSLSYESLDRNKITMRNMKAMIFSSSDLIFSVRTWSITSLLSYTGYILLKALLTSSTSSWVEKGTEPQRVLEPAILLP